MFAQLLDEPHQVDQNRRRLARLQSFAAPDLGNGAEDFAQGRIAERSHHALQRLLRRGRRIAFELQQ